nr:hypothetical protein Iba_chr09cCG10550 [Ipomoea batatas]
MVDKMNSSSREEEAYSPSYGGLTLGRILFLQGDAPSVTEFRGPYNVDCANEMLGIGTSCGDIMAIPSLYQLSIANSRLDQLVQVVIIIEAKSVQRPKDLR